MIFSIAAQFIDIIHQPVELFVFQNYKYNPFFFFLGFNYWGLLNQSIWIWHNLNVFLLRMNLSFGAWEQGMTYWSYPYIVDVTLPPDFRSEQETCSPE